MSGERSLALSKLVKDQEMLSEVEVASVVAPLLERLRALHETGRAHGNVSLATVTIRVVEPADGTIHLLDPECCNEAAHRPCVGCQQTQEGATVASDIWSVGIIAVQLLLGRPCRDCCHAPIINTDTGDMPMLPRGTSFECIDFLMDCLAPNPEERAQAEDLMAHDFLRILTAPRGPMSPDAAEALADTLADCLLISPEGKQHEPACRPRAVPRLAAKGRVSFSAPSHTARCAQSCCLCRMTSQQQQEDHEQQSMGPMGAPSRCEKSPKTSPSTTHSAARTKRKASDRDGAVAPKRKCSGLVKYLSSPALVPMSGELTTSFVLEA